jgi:lipopolysaccharide export system permease protein
MLAGDILYTLAEFLTTRRIGVHDVSRLLVYKLPAILVITFPVSTLLGTLLGLGRLARDRELQAMRLAGLSLARIFAPVIAFGVATMGTTLAINEFLAPWANQKANALIRQALLGGAFPQVREQVFFRGPMNRIFYVGAMDGARQELRNVMIYELDSTFPRLTTASSARWEGTVWHLRDGVVRDLDAHGWTRYEARFTSMDIAVGVEGSSILAGQKTPEEMTARELRHYLILFRGQESAARFAVEYHRKFSVPFASVAFALLAAPLGIRMAQGGRFVGVGSCVVLLFAYYVLMSVGKALGTTGMLDPFVAAWMPNLCFLITGLALWLHTEGWPAGLWSARPGSTHART